MFELTTKPKPFNYLLTYKYSQDHLELLFSCIRSRGGWNNNPNGLQMKYALRKMQNAITASKNANCIDFTGCSNIIPIFHTRKHQKKTSEEQTQNKEGSSNSSEENEINLMYEHLAFQEHSEFKMFCFISLGTLCQNSWTNCLVQSAKNAWCLCLHSCQSMDMTILQVYIMNVERHHLLQLL
jgi:hypothetical protein